MSEMNVSVISLSSERLFNFSHFINVRNVISELSILQVMSIMLEITRIEEEFGDDLHENKLNLMELRPDIDWSNRV